MGQAPSIGWRGIITTSVMAVLIFSSSIIYGFKVAQGSGGVHIRFFNESYGALAGVEAWVQVWAVNPEATPPIIEIYHGTLRNGELFISASDKKFREVLDSWCRAHPEDERYETFLEVCAWIKLGNKVYTYPSLIINYNPIRVLKSVVSQNIILNLHSEILGGARPQWEMELITPMTAPAWIYDPNVSWFSNVPVEVPVLIIHNDRSTSGVIQAYMSILNYLKSGFRVSVGYGLNIKDKLLSGIMPEVSFQIGSFTFSGKYIFENITFVPPNEKRYFWMKAKVIHAHFREVIYVGGQAYPSGREKIEDYIYDVQVSGNRYVGGVSSGSSIYESRIFDGSVEERLKIGGTAPADEHLDVGESIFFSYIFPYYDIYQQDCEIGIPIGAIIAALASSSLPSGVLAFIAGITVSLSYGESASIYISGHLTNLGQYQGVGYNVPEAIYCRVSKFQYQTPTGYKFKVPMGIYFRCS